MLINSGRSKLSEMNFLKRFAVSDMLESVPLADWIVCKNTTSVKGSSQAFQGCKLGFLPVDSSCSQQFHPRLVTIKPVLAMFQYHRHLYLERSWEAVLFCFGKGIFPSLLDEEFGCNECMNVGSKRWKLKTTSMLVYRCNSLSSEMMLKFPLN